MPDWKRVRVDFSTVKLGNFIEPVKMTIAQSDISIYGEVYGVTNTEGIVKTGKKASADISKYIIIDRNYFAYNPYRINVGSIGVNFNGLKGCVSPAYVVFKTREGLDPVFLWYYLKSDFGNHLINWYGNRGGVRNALRYDDLCKIDIPAIDYEKQLEVIRKVDHYNQEKTKLNIELRYQQFLLKQLRQAILQEAVEGKLTAEWRKQQQARLLKEYGNNLGALRELRENHPDYSAKALLEKIKAEKEALTKNTKGTKKTNELPPISEDEKPFDLPEGWVWCSWENLLSSEKYSMKRGPFGSSLRKSIFVKKGIRVFEQYNAINDDPYWSRYYITPEKYHELKAFTAKPGDLLISCSGVTLGRITELPAGAEIGIINQALLKLKLNDDLISNAFFKNLFRSSYIQKNIFGMAWGIAIPNMIGVKELKKILIALPPLAEQQAIVEKVDRLMAKIDALEEQVKVRKAQAGQLMHAVLREAFSGKTYPRSSDRG